MPCQRCNKAAATVHLLDIVPPDGEKRERHLCEKCATEEGITAVKHEPISSILDTFVKHSAGVEKNMDVECPECGTTFREFRSQGLLGCPNDYEAFRELLTPLLERAHGGATHHVGKVPARLGGTLSRHAKIAKLRREMAEAVELEDYELAARLRDDIKDMESQS